MNKLHTLEDIQALKETWQIECKLAQGRDGEGALPHDIWETYSAFANTQGGDIFLGLRELAQDRYELAGIPNAQKVLDIFLASAHNPKIISANLICIDNVAIVRIEGLDIIHIHVPKAPVYYRPVFINNDPVNGCYIRIGEADMKLSPERLKKMKANIRGELIGKS